MKRIIISFGLLLILGGIGAAFAEPFATGRVMGAAPVTIDGSFSDWDGLNVLPAPVAGINGASQAGLPRDDADLSAAFRCILDDTYLYIAVQVTDDLPVFGEERAGQPYWDDCVEVMIYGPATGLTPMKIWVSLDKNGEVRLEGRDSIQKISYPGIWAKRGVAAALQPGNAGYGVELMIPRSVPESIGWLDGQPLRMNVAVYDDDTGGKFESIRQWANISINASNEVSFAEVLSLPVVSKDFESVLSFDSAVQEIELVLDSPDANLEIEIVDPAVQLDLALAFERVEMYSEAIAELKKAVGVSGVPETENMITLALARNYFFMNDYNTAEQLCTGLLTVETDDIRLLDANMILLSIELNRTVLSEQ
ncbi:MAG: sugar-binding protein [Candidatus Latescibacterota bacterium]